jgi:hypothetical protein
MLPYDRSFSIFKKRPKIITQDYQKRFSKPLIFLFTIHVRLRYKNRIFNFHFGPLRKFLTQNAEMIKNREKN